MGQRPVAHLLVEPASLRIERFWTRSQGIELLRDSDQLAEHACRLSSDGAYYSMMSSRITDFMILNFRAPVPTKAQDRGVASVGFTPCIINSSLDPHNGQKAMALQEKAQKPWFFGRFVTCAQRSIRVDGFT
ncbi:hypothetical protein BDP27DRAFT_48223 [Rhodocollybia butyracea]|uniref:Uncharacterized protein n=1 Tax=Rhodocollybia butyracea TaxID=206335 RepID=A0A9P5PP50_9AGAR|nr:hypothetical protein BDP27DRAFT_48223 [Rhodocollybia butyracea]